jgi:ArsR family transcriptional regulator
METLKGTELHSLYEARARILKALAHPSRLFIVEQLREGERCVNELTEMVGADVSTISRHLSVLKNAGIVSDEKRGTSIYYCLRVPCILDFMHCVETVLEANAQEQMNLVACCKNR